MFNSGFRVQGLGSRLPGGTPAGAGGSPYDRTTSDWTLAGRNLYYCLNSSKGVKSGNIIGVTKGDTRSSNYSSYV